MFLLVLFDLPTKTDAQKKAYRKLSKGMSYAGFQRLQYSVYTRVCPSQQAADRHTKCIMDLAPAQCHINILRVTDKQMGAMVSIDRDYKEKVMKPTAWKQLTIF